jgi:hypothetical protein
MATDGATGVTVPVRGQLRVRVEREERESLPHAFQRARDRLLAEARAAGAKDIAAVSVCRVVDDTIEVSAHHAPNGAVGAA